MSSFLLVHPPLLGPAVWRRCADVLRRRGHDVFVPDLRPAVAASDGWWERYAEICRAVVPAAQDDLIVAGHSGSGVVLPLVAREVAATRVVFVDAMLPALAGETAPSAQIREFTARLAEGGCLPRWSDWWPEGELVALLADARVRADLFAELPRLRADFYDHAVPVPDGWSDGLHVQYLRLSPAYDAAAAEASRRGWQVSSIDGTHLQLVSDPDQIATLLESDR